MNLIPWSPFGGDVPFNKELGGMFDFSPFKLWGGLSSPSVDVYQTVNDVVVKAEIPGVAKEDLELFIDENTVRISGQNRKDSEFKEEETFRTERYYGTFSRSIPLPAGVRYEEAKAEYKDGILSVVIPKSTAGKPSGHKIDIQ